MGYGGYGGMGYGGTGPVIQEPVDTGNHHLDDCYYQTLGNNGGRQT